MKDLIKDYLTFSRNEQRGLAVVLVLLILSLATRYYLLSRIPGQEYDPGKFRAEAERFLAEIRLQDSLAEASEKWSGAYRPNYARPGVTVKGGQFSKKKKASDTLRQKTTTQYPERERVVVELNSADSALLTTLDGVGPYFASRMIKYRELLGGFHSKEQLMEVKGMDTARYDIISDWVTADTCMIRKMDINRVTFKEMLRHPYFEYNLVKAIFQKRDKIKRFDSIGQLKELDIVYDDLYLKIRPYLEVREDTAVVHD
jgi:DNA uptake protein ComE-like DNA-binding protein